MGAEDFLTTARLRRLDSILVALRKVRGGRVSVPDGYSYLWKVCGGAFDELPEYLATLEAADLIRLTTDYVQLTKTGQNVATQDHVNGGRLLASAVLRSGLLAEQTRKLTELSAIGPSGDLSCPRRVAINAAPQLVSLLRRWPDVEFSEFVVIPQKLVLELEDAWVTVPKDVYRKSDETRRTVGLTGELLSYHFLRAGAPDRNLVRWVARDNDNLGYDIEDRRSPDVYYVEVKASVNSDVRFFLSRNEFDSSKRLGDHYIVHFWGEVNISRAPREEYRRLRKLGYPRIYRGLASVIEEGVLVARPSQYEVNEACR